MPEPREILTICSSLITLTNDAYNASDEESDNEPSRDSQDLDNNRVAATSDSEGPVTFVRLAHFSVKEYLVSNRIQHGSAPRYSVREIESHGVIAADCISYILQFDEPGSITPETLELSPLAHYAAEFWVFHAQGAEKGPIKSTNLLIMELFMTKGEGFLNWIRIFDIDSEKGKSGHRLDDLTLRLYYASLAGLFEPVKLLTERNVDVNSQGGRFGNALQAASYSGQVDVVQVLLDNGADVNAHGGCYGNALQAASHMSGIDVVQILLGNGADVNAHGGIFEYALHVASSS